MLTNIEHSAILPYEETFGQTRGAEEKQSHLQPLSSLPNPARKKVSQGRGPGAGGEPSEVYEVTPTSAAGEETLTEDTQLNAQGPSMPSERPGGGSSVKRC